MKAKQVVNALSVDVEEHFQVAAFDSSINRADWENISSRVEANTHGVLELFAAKGVRATFFVLGWIAERYPALVRHIVAEGHELACHGYSHRKIYTQSKDEFWQETRRAKGVLEDISGVPVLGYRAASFSITTESLWALDILIEEGFVYDSSIFPVRHDNYGIPGAAPNPSMLTAPSGRRIAELPMSTVGFGGLRLPVGGGGYFRLYPYWLTRMALKYMNQANRGFVFYSHPWEIDVEQPRVTGAPWLSRFRHYNNLEKFQSRLELLLDEFPTGTCVDVLRKCDLLPVLAGSDAVD